MGMITGLSLEEAVEKLKECLEKDSWYPDDHVLFDHQERFPQNATADDKTVEIKSLLWEGMLTLNVGYESDTFICLAPNYYGKGRTRIAIAFYFEQETEEVCVYHFYRKDLW